MSRYRGPRLKKIRRLGALPGLTSKSFKKDPKKQSRFKRRSRYRIRLEEKQKLCFHYGLTERQLLKYVHIAGKAKGATGLVLLQLLEMRLDNILFRLGMALTIPGAKQVINHRHILVNGRIVDIPSYRCKPGDIITTRHNEISKRLIETFVSISTHQIRKWKRSKIPPYLRLTKTVNGWHDKGLVNGIIDRKSIGLRIKELLVVEYYSRQI